MPGHPVGDLLLPNIPYLDITINSPRINLIPRLRNRNSRDGKLCLNEINCALHPRVPKPNTPIIRSRNQDLLPTRRRRDIVDDFRVALMLAYALPGLEVPGRERCVRGSGEEEGRIARPVEGEDGGFVACKGAIILALAVGAPEEDSPVHGAGGYEVPGGVEAGGEDFAGVACGVDGR